MQTIGEKLEEARKRRGISIREASEVTKIRSDYLASFENNSFDVNLPEVYIRGFLRNYALFLKLNAEKILTDYSAHQLGESSFTKREFLGRMDIPAESPEQPPEHKEGQFSVRQPPANPQNNDRQGFNYNNFDRASLLKGGIAIAGGGLFIAIVILLILAFLRSGPGETVVAQDTGDAAARQEIVLIASGGDIGSVTVTEVSNDQQLFRGPLNRGDRHTVPFTDRVRVNVTDAEFLQIEYNGNLSRLQGRGPGRITFPPRSQ